MSSTGRAVVLTPVWPNAGVEAWYKAELDKLVAEMYHDSRAVILPAAEDTPAIIAADDAALPATAAGILFRCRDRYLIAKRANNTGWGIPGGKIERGESPDECARRETWEETTIWYRGPLTFRTLHKFRDVRFVTFEADIDEQFEPTLDREHSEYKWATLGEALLLDLHPGLRLTLTGASDSPELASDATPTKQLERLLEKWGQQWIKRFDLAAQKISLDFAAKNQNATQTAMQASLKKAGFTVPFKPTRASIEAYKAVAAEQVGLIKSIAQKYHTDVQTQVWQSVKRGADLRTLSQQLEKNYGVTRRRAALIARDQNAKAKATIEAVRHQEIGIRQAIWMHSKAGKEPRPTHVAMNNKLYDLNKGMWDSDEQKYIHPGELINCRCTMRPYIPGFEGAMPDWDIAQT
jgi:SPP1 gp7 family putative phage head morphogenesis protein